MTSPFAYIGRGLTPDEFASYVAGYDFGTIPPDFVVLHSTEIPSATWARFAGNAAVWDEGEAGLSTPQIYEKRRRQLDNTRNYYRDTLGWPAGPHLWIDERWIWLFTPMAEIGVHARQGNSYRTGGHLHYSIGVEVVGYYERVAWPDSVARNVAWAVAVLKRRLGTFDYIAGPWAGKISRHADYNKPECPGGRIVPAFYMPILRQGWDELNLTDIWTKWGVRFPLPVERRTWGIPQIWKAHADQLGEARSFEDYIVPDAVAVQAFQGGTITFEKASGQCSITSLSMRLP